MASIVLEHVAKTFPSGQAVRDLSLAIADGELLVLVGPSGSGKSTVLRLIAGLESPSSGRILIDDREVTMVSPQDRDLAMVFQSYALYPHKTVRENLAFGLQVRRMAAAAIAARVHHTATSLGIEALLDRRPAQLSGGQRQRVALGRAIVREPKAFLLDEPLSNLDPLLRLETRTELGLLHRRLRATMVYVTHDQEEAMTLGERVAVMRDGSLEQLAPPMELYRSPANLFVARFIGSPAMNLIRCTWRHAHGQASAVRGGLAIDVERVDAAHADDEPVLVGVRPNDIELVDRTDADATGRIEIVEPLGATSLAHVRLDERPDGLVRVVVPSESSLAIDGEAGLRLRRERLFFFSEATGARVRAVPVLHRTLPRL